MLKLTKDVFERLREKTDESEHEILRDVESMFIDEAREMMKQAITEQDKECIGAKNMSGWARGERR